jgi:hypothetical protein
MPQSWAETYINSLKIVFTNYLQLSVMPDFIGHYDRGQADLRSAVKEYRYQLQVASDSEMSRYAKKRLSALRH